MHSVLYSDDLWLTTMPTLSFSLKYGACATMNDNEIYLCFSDEYGGDWEPGTETKRCRRSSSPTGDYEILDLSINHHRYTDISTSDSKYSLYSE